MRIAVFSAHPFELPYLQAANAGKHELQVVSSALTEATVQQAAGCTVACIFTKDKADAPILRQLHGLGIKYLALRSAGFNHVDLNAAKELGLKVARVPAYSPHAIAEHAVALMLALNRQLITAHNRIADNNFSLDGLTGFDMWGKTAGIIGTGKTGRAIAGILHGMGCTLLAHDIAADENLKQRYGVVYTDMDTLCAQCDILTLHVPLTKDTHHLINKDRIDLMKPGVMLINTARGALVDTRQVITALKNGRIGYFGMDVYEDEQLYFEDHSGELLQDDILARLITIKNVLITGHQAFLTETALQNIADTTMRNIDCFEQGITNDRFLI